MIVKVFNNKKVIEVGQNNVSSIFFFKSDTGGTNGIDIFLTKDENGITNGIEGFFVGEYQVIKRLEAEQMTIFNLLEDR